MRKRRHHRAPLRPQVRRRPWRRYLVGLVLLLGGIGIAMALWWWLRAPVMDEAPYRPSGEIERVTLTPGANFAQARTLAWRCGESLRPTEVFVSRIGARGDTLRPQRFIPEGEIIATPGGQGAYYHLELDSLQPGASYVYRIQASGAKDYRGAFTLPDEERRTSFTYLGDLRGNPPALTHRIFAFLQREVPSDFYALSGGILPAPTEEAWAELYASLGRIPSGTPFVLAPGIGEAQRAGLSSALDARWLGYFRLPQNGPEGSLGRSYYIDFPLFRLVILDTTDLLGLQRIQLQRSWLEGVLRESTQPWRIVLCHHATDRVEEGEKNLVMHYFFRDALIEAGADLVLQGHDHAYARGTHRSGRGDTIPPLFVVSSASARPTRNGFSPTYDRLGSGLLLYQHVTVEPDKLTFSAYRFPKDSTASREKLRYDSVILRRTSAQEVLIEDLARTQEERFDYEAFASDSRGRKKAAQYAKEVRDRATRRSAKK